MRFLLCAFALSFGVAQAQVVNTINDGATINAGTYLNTPGSETKFINSAGTGITLNAGSNIRGAEFNNGAYTGNGGAIHIQAPDQVVRLNGNIDVRGFLPKGATGNIGNGGNVTIDSAYLFQNGNIYAGGLNGGSVTMNVGGMTMGQNARIDATGQTYLNPSLMKVSGNGGNVTINSTGAVDIGNGALITTSGYGSTTYGNNIVIIGHGVNVDKATLYAGQIDARGEGNGNGIIRISSTGSDADVNISNGSILQTGGNIAINSEHDINQNGSLLSNGAVEISNYGDSPFSPGVKGGNGGTITLTAANAINNTGRIQADGHYSSGGYTLGAGGPTDVPGSVGFDGGNGGVITLTANNVSNTGVIRAMGGNTNVNPFTNAPDDPVGRGGNGGTVNFSSNPTGNGSVITYQGAGLDNATLALFGKAPAKLGTISAPDPAASTNNLIGVWKKN